MPDFFKVAWIIKSPGFLRTPGDFVKFIPKTQ